MVGHSVGVCWHLVFWTDPQDPRPPPPRVWPLLTRTQPQKCGICGCRCRCRCRFIVWYLARSAIRPTSHNYPWSQDLFVHKPYLNSPGSIQPGCHLRRTDLFKRTGLHCPTRYPLTPGSRECTCEQSALPRNTTSEHIQHSRGSNPRSLACTSRTLPLSHDASLRSHLFFQVSAQLFVIQIFYEYMPGCTVLPFPDTHCLSTP